jgi:hypothetical protein
MKKAHPEWAFLSGILCGIDNMAVGLPSDFLGIEVLRRITREDFEAVLEPQAP